jgi:hypothetical protein
MISAPAGKTIPVRQVKKLFSREQETGVSGKRDPYQKGEPINKSGKVPLPDSPDQREKGGLW